MPTIPLTRLAEYRRMTYRSSPDLRITTSGQAADFVNQRNFVFLYPAQGVTLPSLWVAATGDRPVSTQHDDPGQIVWRWKDEFMDKKVWYYAKILRHRSTILSLQVLPYFYALSPNYGDPESDFIVEYKQGKLPMEARLIFETLLKEGALDALALRKAVHLTSAESTPRFNKALEILQQSFKVLPVGIAEVGAWKYAFIYDLTHRYFPELLEQARPISENQAFRTIITNLINSVGVANEKDIVRLFNWRPQDVQRAIEYLSQDGTILSEILVEGKTGSFLASAELA